MGAGAPPRMIVGCRAGGGPGGSATGVGGPSDRSAYECWTGCSRPFGRRVRARCADRGRAADAVDPAHGQVIGWLRSLPGPVRVTYEAGPTGFGLVRALEAAQTVDRTRKVAWVRIDYRRGIGLPSVGRHGACSSPASDRAAPVAAGCSFLLARWSA